MYIKNQHYDVPQYESKKFKLLPKGHYKASLVDLEEKQGNYGDYICIKWEIQTPSEYKGRILWDNFAVNADDKVKREKALANFLILVDAFIGKGQDFNDNNWQQMLNKEAELVVGIWKKDDDHSVNSIYQRIPLSNNFGKVLLDQAKGLSPTLQSDIEALNDDIPF